jgi:hypothetical protein
MTKACGELNLIFKQSEQKVSSGLIKLRNRQFNAYWGRVDDSGTFPKNSGTQIKGLRLPRIGISNEHGWETIEDSLCSTNACAEKCPEVIHNGFEEYFYSIVRRCIRTDWLCLNSLIFREMPDEEIAHFEQGMREATRYVWDEAYRTRYNHMAGNKIVGLVDAADLEGDTCDCHVLKCAPDLRCDGWMFERRRTAAGEFGEIDERYIRVNVSAAEISRISELTLDMLDEAAQELEYDDESMPAIQDGIDLFDVVLAHNKMGVRFAETENQQMDQAMSYGGFKADMLKRKLGTKRVFRDMYSVRYDLFSMRFYPDADYNANELPEFGAYNPNNPQTWARFKRVFAYIPQAITTRTDGPGGAPGGAGIKYVKNQNFLKAPFGISCIFSKSVISGLQFPENNGYGSAQKKAPGTTLGYAGSATWMNPDWECNENREFGFWKMRYGFGVKPKRTEFGWNWFHRIDHRIAMVGNCCAINGPECEAEVSPYCYSGMGGEFEELNGQRGANKVTITNNWC